MQGQKPATSEEARRLDAIASLWCLPCAMDGWDGVPPTVQHVVEGRVRLGHKFTYPSCEWHHLGKPPPSVKNAEAVVLYGPSLAGGKRTFEGIFGSERELVEITNICLQHREDLASNGDVFMPEQFGLIVRNEAYARLGRTVSIGR